MEIHYYFSIFPMEALIASQLEPEHFGSYMATGSKKGSAERIIFCELSGDFGDSFNWEYARENCVQHPNGDPKNSVYLGVYKVLEKIPFDVFGSIYLTTPDGRTLELARQEEPFSEPERKFYVYKELCPVSPIVVSVLKPEHFSAYMTDPLSMIYVPKIVFADLKVIDFNNQDDTGNIGPLYERKIQHLKQCVFSVTEVRDKVTKIFDRSYFESFSYQTINHAIFIGDGDNLIVYPMKSESELRDHHYDWAKSAMIF